MGVRDPFSKKPYINLPTSLSHTLPQVIGGLLMGDMRGLAERVSEGRSGSLFYYSHDGKFMVTLPPSLPVFLSLNPTLP